ncbi:MAG: response regulator transcription factor, partial [Flavobacteriales bacterium]
GFKVCRSIRLKDTDIPILFLTAKDSAKDRVYGLKVGGDDYLTKPFDLEELLLRVNKLLKRSTSDQERNEEEEFIFNGNKVNFRTYEVEGNGQKQALSAKELMVLRLLVMKRNEVVSREEILESVWGYDVYPSTRTIDNFILKYRKIFEKDPSNPEHFHSIRGVGYKFTP